MLYFSSHTAKMNTTCAHLLYTGYLGHFCTIMVLHCPGHSEIERSSGSILDHIKKKALRLKTNERLKKKKRHDGSSKLEHKYNHYIRVVEKCIQKLPHYIYLVFIWILGFKIAHYMENVAIAIKCLYLDVPMWHSPYNSHNRPNFEIR